jgi:K+-transporting ATPase KdpF subunit
VRKALTMSDIIGIIIGLILIGYLIYTIVRPEKF